MRASRTSWRGQAARLARGLAAPALLALAGPARADDARVPDALPAVAPAAAPVLNLSACRQIALEKQPAVAAARASLAAAAARSEAVDRLHVPTFLARDLPVRRRQAALGVQSAQAALAQAEADAVHSVTFTYLAALYARQQVEVADKALVDLKGLQDLAKEIVNSGSRPDVTGRHVDQIGVYILVARARREEAVQGFNRAVSGLREAMGVGPDYPLALADARMPGTNPAVDRDQVIAQAVARRGEVAQAATAAEVTCLEVDAQASNRHGRKVNTFAAGSDIHANVLPAGEHGENYKPGAVALEMPTLIAGSRDDRMEQARAYHARAQAVADKARGLVALEAEQAYLRWLEASRKAPPAREAADAAEKLSAGLRQRFDPRAARITMDELLNAGVLSSQLRIQANQAHYQLLIALASLERVTAGGFAAGLDLPAPPAGANGKRPNGTEPNGKEP